LETTDSNESNKIKSDYDYTMDDRISFIIYGIPKGQAYQFILHYICTRGIRLLLYLILFHKIFFFRIVMHSFYKSQVNIRYQSLITDKSMPVKFGSSVQLIQFKNSDSSQLHSRTGY